MFDNLDSQPYFDAVNDAINAVCKASPDDVDKRFEELEEARRALNEFCDKKQKGKHELYTCPMGRIPQLYKSRV